MIGIVKKFDPKDLALSKLQMARNWPSFGLTFLATNYPEKVRG